MRRAGSVLLCAALALAAGCEAISFPPQRSAPAPSPAPPAPRPVDMAALGKAYASLNKAFQDDYERALSERGARSVPVRRGEAFEALYAGLVRLGMIVESRDPDAGTLTVAAPAPRPLDIDEWNRAEAVDLPRLRGYLCPVLGDARCQAIRFEPDGLVIVINAAVLAGAGGGAEISLTARMREIERSKSGIPRREYPPPAAVRMALEKIWGRFDEELVERQKRRGRQGG